MKKMLTLLLILSIASADGREMIDTDQDGIDDLVEKHAGLDPRNPLDAQGDLDGDGINNQIEFLAGANIAKRDRVAGVVNDEVWEKTNSGNVSISTMRTAAQNVPISKGSLSSTVVEKELSPMDFFTRRIRGYITPKVSGTYTFWATADDDCQIFLSSDESKWNRKILIDCAVPGYRNFDADPSMKSESIPLEQGKSYYFEIWHCEGRGGSEVNLVWQSQDGTRQPITSEYLSSYECHDPNDADDDDLLDSYEKRNGLNPAVAGHVKEQRDGYYGDFDQDGLSNGEEQELGTAANQADTDLDGVSDRDEALFLKTDPTKKDASALADVAEYPGSAFTSNSGSWTRDPCGHAEIAGNSGSLGFRLKVQKEGYYAAKFRLSCPEEDHFVDQNVSIFINGKLILQRKIWFVENHETTVMALLPYLHENQEYEVKLSCATNYNQLKLRLNRMHLCEATGRDDNQNKKVDWVEALNERNNGWDQEQLLSQTSPAVIEGRVHRRALLQPHGHKVYDAPNSRFYTELELSPLMPRTQQMTFENGDITKTCQVVWIPTNLHAQPSMVIRQGDSLRLTYLKEQKELDDTAKFTLSVEGKQYKSKVTEPCIVNFPNAGDILVRCLVRQSNGTTTETQHTITVVPKIDLGDSPFLRGIRSAWTAPELPSGSSIEFDQQTDVHFHPTSKQHSIIMNHIEEQPVIVRHLKNGLILGAGRLRCVSVERINHEYITTPEGKKGWALSFLVQGEIEDEEIRIHLLGNDVLFADGSKFTSLFKADIDHQRLLHCNIFTGPKTALFGNTVSIWKDGKKVAEAF